MSVLHKKLEEYKIAQHMWKTWKLYVQISKCFQLQVGFAPSPPPLIPVHGLCPWTPLRALRSDFRYRLALYAIRARHVPPSPHLITKLTPVALLVITSWFQFFCSQWNAKTENEIKFIELKCYIDDWYYIQKSPKAEYDYQKGIRKASQIVCSEHTKLESVGPAPQTLSWGSYRSRPLPF